MRVSSKENYTSFNAIPLSKWKCLARDGMKKDVTLLLLENKDLKVISQNSNLFLELVNHVDETRKEIISSSINTIKALFENRCNVEIFEKIKILLAVEKKNLCGILIANIPKINLNNDNYVYSSRHNAAKKESEIDWLVTWTPQKEEKTSGVGKSLVVEYFRTLKEDDLRDVFVRSEIPEYSYATKFYESLGFEKLTNKNVKLSNRNTNKYVVNNFAETEDLGVPMIITRRKINEESQKIIDKMCRKSLPKESIDLNELIKPLAKKS